MDFLDNITVWWEGIGGNNRLKDVYLLAKIEESETVAKNMKQRDLWQYLPSSKTTKGKMEKLQHQIIIDGKTVEIMNQEEFL